MYYIIPKNVYDQFAQGRFASAHYIDLPDGDVLVTAKFVHEGARNEVENHKTVIALPHPMSSETVGSRVAAKLAHIGVTESHRTYDVAKLAAKIHPMMRLR